MPVRILEEHLINKIAAGEVVERPASVVKELFENALDAGGTTLRVHLRAGGRNLIKVVDDGSGMNRTDCLMCTERHATSKIRTDEDLFRVSTLGFRGEAIPAIAAVSRFEILSRTHDAEVGTRVRMEGGKMLEVEPAGCAPGTEMTVASLFYNVPARRKFLRSVDTELGHCVEAVTREALIRPGLDLTVTHDERELVRAPAVATRARRAADLLGPHGEALVPVMFVRGNLKVEALVSPVGVHRATPTGCTWLYVNGRFVKDLVLRRAVTAAYAGIVPKDRYPVVILEVTVPTEDVDVNVHPAKTEVRFAHGWELQGAVTEGLRAALQDHGIRRPVAVESRYRPAVQPEPEQVSMGLPAEPVRGRLWDGRRDLDNTSTSQGSARPESARSESAGRPFTVGAPPLSTVPQPPVPQAMVPFGTLIVSDPGADGSMVPGPAAAAGGEAVSASVGVVRRSLPDPGYLAPQSAPNPAPGDAVRGPALTAPPPADVPTAEAAPRRGGLPLPPPPAPDSPGVPPDHLLPVARFRDLRVIGQLSGTYLLCEGARELVIVDQHAAHERVTLHRLSRDPRATLGGAQRLLSPVLVDLPLARARALAPHTDSLAEWGLEVRPMGGSTFAVQALPAILRDADLVTLLTDIADEVAEGGPARAAAEIVEHFLATLACHTSVRAGQQLSVREMEELLKALDEVDFSVCAHGRPVAIRVSPGELERRFHRA